MPLCLTMAVVVRVPCHGHAPARIWSSAVETSAPAGWEAPLPAAALERGATLRSGVGGTGVGGDARGSGDKIRGGSGD